MKGIVSAVDLCGISLWTLEIPLNTFPQWKISMMLHGFIVWLLSETISQPGCGLQNGENLLYIFICIMLCSSLSIVRLSLSWYTTLGCTKQKKQWLMRQASIETAGLTSLASENHSERLNSWPQQLLLPYWISMFVWFYLCERSLWTRKADLVLVLGSSLSVPTACDLPEICLEARDGKPETCRHADSKTFIGIRNRGCS